MIKLLRYFEFSTNHNILDGKVVKMGYLSSHKAKNFALTHKSGPIGKNLTYLVSLSPKSETLCWISLERKIVFVNQCDQNCWPRFFSGNQN